MRAGRDLNGDLSMSSHHVDKEAGTRGGTSFTQGHLTSAASESRSLSSASPFCASLTMEVVKETGRERNRCGLKL